MSGDGNLKVNYLLDSNVIIDSLSARLPLSAIEKMRSIVDSGFFISVISQIEVLGFAPEDKSLNSNTERFINTSNILELTSDIVQKTIELRRTIKIKLPDAVIAATALVHNLILLTHNIRDFNKIPSLIVLDSYSL